MEVFLTICIVRICSFLRDDSGEIFPKWVISELIFLLFSRSFLFYDEGGDNLSIQSVMFKKYFDGLINSLNILLRGSTYLGGAKLHKYFLEQFVIIKKGEIININIYLLILMIANLIKIY